MNEMVRPDQSRTDQVCPVLEFTWTPWTRNVLVIAVLLNKCHNFKHFKQFQTVSNNFKLFQTIFAFQCIS